VPQQHTKEVLNDTHSDPPERHRKSRTRRSRDRNCDCALRALCRGADREGGQRADAARRRRERGAGEADRRSTHSEQLALGRVFIQYRTENLRILPVYGNAALAVSPRLGHLHYYVDGQSWPTVDSSGETVVLVGLQSGPHKVRLELADATHKPIPGATQLVEFTVPPRQ
jgi:hypothetical protein